VRAGRGGARGLADQPGRPRHTRQRGAAVDGLSDVSTTIKWPVIETVNPRPFDPCEDIPLDVIQRIGLAYTPPSHEDGLRCHYDAVNYQMAVGNAADDVDCLQTNLQRGRELSPFYVY
jgi:hypothetical protein